MIKWKQLVAQLSIGLLAVITISTTAFAEGGTTLTTARRQLQCKYYNVRRSFFQALSTTIPKG